MRAGFGGAFAQALAFAEYLLQDEVAGRERIGQAQRTQRHVVRGPRADAGQGGGLLDEVLQRLRAAELQPALDTGTGQGAYGGGAGTRQADGLQRCIDQIGG